MKQGELNQKLQREFILKMDTRRSWYRSDLTNECIRRLESIMPGKEFTISINPFSSWDYDSFECSKKRANTAKKELADEIGVRGYTANVFVRTNISDVDKVYLHIYKHKGSRLQNAEM